MVPFEMREQRMRIFERLPGRAHAAPPQRKRYDGIFAGRLTRDHSTEAAAEPVPVAVQNDDGARGPAETKAHEA
jgi:hypothetical protein